jgi:hypothetical protein
MMMLDYLLSQHISNSMQLPRLFFGAPISHKSEGLDAQTFDVVDLFECSFSPGAQGTQIY